jgi:cytoskeletal protein CcmA (bactofilin family)
MFKKRETKPEETHMNYQKNTLMEDKKMEKSKNIGTQETNTILKGSKLIGDINISYNLELSGEVEGNITSEQGSNIVIKGLCKGNITTKGGNVEVEGELTDGDIIAGGDVKITGKFNGGMVKAGKKIHVLGEFTGKLEGNEIEIGPKARGKGELFYKEYIAISRGAQIEAKINQTKEERKDTKKPHDAKVINIERPSKDTPLTS